MPRELLKVNKALEEVRRMDASVACKLWELDRLRQLKMLWTKGDTKHVQRGG